MGHYFLAPIKHLSLFLKSWCVLYGSTGVQMPLLRAWIIASYSYNSSSMYFGLFPTLNSNLPYSITQRLRLKSSFSSPFLSSFPTFSTLPFAITSINVDVHLTAFLITPYTTICLPIYPHLSNHLQHYSIIPQYLQRCVGADA